mmetsp:Transcript_1462/g.5756  ORF Transcript_1462/g.5756 Transcript_1462/m.5756 type:complete len:225 (+) Transcript_1462:347-1021(+)
MLRLSRPFPGTPLRGRPFPGSPARPPRGAWARSKMGIPARPNAARAAARPWGRGMRAELVPMRGFPGRPARLAPLAGAGRSWLARWAAGWPPRGWMQLGRKWRRTGPQARAIRCRRGRSPPWAWRAARGPACEQSWGGFASALAPPRLPLPLRGPPSPCSRAPAPAARSRLASRRLARRQGSRSPRNRRAWPPLRRGFAWSSRAQRVRWQETRHLPGWLRLLCL